MVGTLQYGEVRISTEGVVGMPCALCRQKKYGLFSFANNVDLEQVCEAVAAERAGWTERTAGQQPADALKKFSAGGRKPSSKPRVRPMSIG